MRVNKKVSGIRSFSTDLIECHVFVGDGDAAGSVKTVRFHANVTSPLLRLEWERDGGGRVTRLKSILLDSDLEARGWMLAKEAYEAEDRLDDYEVFLDYYRACNLGAADQELPDSFLPKSVLELRSSRKLKKHMWRPPAKSSKKVVPSGPG